MKLLLQILTLIGSVAMLMYGMKVMSEGLQKMAGSKLSAILGTATTNRFSGVLTGAFITASIQSSTATTVMTVSFVSAGLLTLRQAISVIFGANIGTTFTAWIMVLGGSSFDMRMIVYAAIVIVVQLNAILATFHTAFNVCNVIILIGFIPMIEKLVCRLLPTKTTEDDFMLATNIEHEINNYRNMLKAQNTLNITEREYDYLTGVNYTDIIGECEKMGDYIINVEEAVSDRKAN